jgi:hypothetical protein
VTAVSVMPLEPGSRVVVADHARDGAGGHARHVDRLDALRQRQVRRQRREHALRARLAGEAVDQPERRAK